MNVRGTKTTKICPDCGEEKSRERDFYSRGAKDNSGSSSKCKECFNKYCTRRWQDIKRDAVKLLGGRCADCKGVFHQNVYDFHHLRDKDLVWNKLRLRPWANIVAELAKCILLCANCHRLRHIDEGKYPQHDSNAQPAV